MRKFITIVMVCFITSISFFSLPIIYAKNSDQEQPILKNYDLLIVTPEKFLKQCEKLIEHKNTLNISSITKTTEEIYKEYKGCDEQEKIKYCIKQTYDDYHISFVLLLGDFKEIPVRYCYNNDQYHSLEPYFISDLYYADLYDNFGFFSTWDTNNNGIYGEWTGRNAEDKFISLTPEVALGRLPCSNTFQVKRMIKKIINYENTEKNDEWFNRIVVAGGDTYSVARGYNDKKYFPYEGEQLTLEVIELMPGFEPTILWASDKTLSSYSLIKSINKGCGFLFLSGHGSPGLWCTHPPNSSKKVGKLSNELVPLLRNKNKLPVCILGGCQNSRIDVHPLRLFKEPYQYDTWRNKCLSWKLSSSAFGGSIATLGSTGLSWQGIEFGGGGLDWLNIQFFKEYGNGINNLGTIWKNAIIAYLDEFPIRWYTASGKKSSIDAKTVQEWIIIGDPTLQIGV